MAVTGLTSGLGRPCDEYEATLRKADAEQAYDKYADTVERQQAACTASGGV